MNLNKYKHFFFDLDDTLWDFEANSRASLKHLFQAYDLAAISGWTFQEFEIQYRKINNEFWTLYRKNLVGRQEIREGRFKEIFEVMGISSKVSGSDFAASYLSDCPKRTLLVPEALDFVKHLSAKGYSMHIITNGFDDVQHFKISNSGLDKYFESVMTSDAARSKKPNRAIFDLALGNVGAKNFESVMIGDSLESDITGAIASGLDPLFFNRKSEAPPADIVSFNRFSDLNKP